MRLRGCGLLGLGEQCRKPLQGGQAGSDLLALFGQQPGACRGQRLGPGAFKERFDPPRFRRRVEGDVALVGRVADPGDEAPGDQLAELDADVAELPAEAGRDFRDSYTRMAFNDPEDFEHPVGERPDAGVIVRFPADIGGNIDHRDRQGAVVHGLRRSFFCASTFHSTSIGAGPPAPMLKDGQAGVPDGAGHRLPGRAPFLRRRNKQ